MLKHHEFMTLPCQLQIHHLQASGTYLATRYFERYKIDLYHLHSFFAESWYDGAAHRVLEVRTFTSTRCLDAYTDFIDLEDLESDNG